MDLNQRRPLTLGRAKHHFRYMKKHTLTLGISEEMYQMLTVRAASERISVSDYVKILIARDLKSPNLAKLEARMAELVQPDSLRNVVRNERETR